MFLHREGFPEEGELVYCTVTQIQYHAVTATLDEYGKQGLIHISEVSPGRIRNIRDFVTEGKKIVCKVIRIDTVRGHVDLSLRRANESQKRNKTDMIKQELKAEKIIISLAERTKVPAEKLYSEIAPSILKNYDMIFQAFEDIVENNVSLEELGLKKELAESLVALVKEKIKPKKVEIIMKVTVQSYDEDGLEIIKQTFEKANEIDKSITANYLGAGTYRMVITAKDYKKAEAVLKEVEEKMSSFTEKSKGEIKFERQD